MDRLLLKFVMLFAPIWSSLGADIDQLKAILEMRLINDDRRPLSPRKNNSNKKSIKRGALLKTFVFTIWGALYLFFAMVVDDKIASMTIFFSLMLVMLTLTLFGDFSNVLFDNRDKLILFVRPITDKTFVLSKMLHVLIYLLRMIIPMALPMWVYLFINDGIASGLLYTIPIVLLILFSLFLVHAFYLLILKFSSVRRFNDILNYVQIANSVVTLVLVYLPSLVFKGLESSAIVGDNFKWYVKILPSYWFAGLWRWIGYSQHIEIWSTALSFIVPVVLGYMTFKIFVPGFIKKISEVDGQESLAETPVKSGKKAQSKNKLALRLSVIFNKSKDAQAGFLVTWALTGRNRSFRIKVYPSFAFIPIYFLYMLSNSKQGLSYMLHNLEHTNRHLLLLYMTSYALMAALNNLVISEQYKASWIYFSAPVKVPGQIILGSFKAMWVKYFLPFFTLSSIFVLGIWGIGKLWDVALAFMNVTCVIMVIAYLNFRGLPFSQKEQMKLNAGKVLRGLVSMFIPFLLGGLHYLAIELWWLKATFMFLSFGITYMFFDSYKNISWAKIDRDLEFS